MSNPFVHLELCTSDTGKAKEFYGKLLGWEFADADMGGGMIYSTFKPSSGPGGGLFTMPGMPTAWTAYVGVEDIQASTAKAKELGANRPEWADGDSERGLDHAASGSYWRDDRVVSAGCELSALKAGACCYCHCSSRIAMTSASSMSRVALLRIAV